MFKFICMFMYVMSSDGLTKEGPSTRKIQGHFFLFQIFCPSQKKVIILKEVTF